MVLTCFETRPQCLVCHGRDITDPSDERGRPASQRLKMMEVGTPTKTLSDTLTKLITKWMVDGMVLRGRRRLDYV